MLNQKLWNKILDSRKTDPSMTVTEIAIRAGIGQSTLSKLIHGITIKENQWKTLAKVLNCSVDEIKPPEIREQIIITFDYVKADLHPEAKIVLWILDNTIFKNKNSFKFSNTENKSFGYSNQDFTKTLEKLAKAKFIKFNPETNTIDLQ